MSNPDLLVVGAGPVGLTMAAEAIRHGMTPRLIDVLPKPVIHSKAQIVHARTLELLEDMGIAERFTDKGIEIRSFNPFAQKSRERLARVVMGRLDSRYQGMITLSQADTEAFLAERLRELGGEVERQVRLESFEQDDDGVSVRLVHEGDGDRVEELRVPYLVGCDGAHSTVRKTLDLPFEGHKYPMDIIQADARVEFPFPVEPDEVIAFIGTDGVVGFFPLPGEKHRYRFLVPGERLREGRDGPSLDQFQDALDRFAPPGSVVSDPKWMVGFSVHCRMVPRIQVGRVFLAGDAGHIHSPAGGQGMNMGMQDAHNLAWKLGLVVNGLGTEALLDSYNAERHEVAAGILRMTDVATKGALANLGLRNRLAVAARDQLLRFVGNLGLVGERMSRMMSMLEIAYTQSPICEEHRGSVLGANVVAEAGSENPSIHSWMAFGGGPKPGVRAPDAIIDPDADHVMHVHDLFRGGKAHTLLLFDGSARTEEGYARMVKTARDVVKRYGDRVVPHLIVPMAERPSDLDYDGSVILDLHRMFHATYAAETECLYLVRPDRHVGFRSQPVAPEPLFAHLARLLIG